MKMFIPTLSIVALCTIGSVSARAVRTSTAQPTSQPTNQPTRITPPVIQQQPVISQPKPREAKTTMTYTEILYELKAKTPDSSDFSTLNNIKIEAEKQLKDITESVQNPRFSGSKKKDIVDYTTEIIKKENVNTVFSQVSDQHIKLVNNNPDGYDIFSEDQQSQLSNIIKKIVDTFKTKYPTYDKGASIIIDLIKASEPVKTLLNKCTNPTVKQSIIDFITTGVNQTWNLQTFLYS